MHTTRETRTPLGVRKNKLLTLENWVLVMRSSPVVLSRTAPVAVLYAANASLAMRTRVVPERNLTVKMVLYA